MNIDEIWKPAPDFENLYEISNFGNVFSHYVNRKVKPQKGKDGSKFLIFRKDGKKYQKRISKLVAQLFVSNPNNYQYVKHIDGNLSNDYYKNLTWSKKPNDAFMYFKTGDFVDDNADYTKYIRSVYISQYGYVASKKLFSEVNKTVLSDMSIDDFMNILCENAEVYSSLVSPKEYNYFNDKSIQDMLIVLRHNLNVTTYYPIMITMVRKNFDIASIRDILYKIICLYVRNNAICQKHSTLYEKMFSDLSVKIYNNTITSMQEINKIISQYMVDDDEFFLSFCNWTACGKNKIAVVRYLLTAIHEYLDNGLELNLNNSEVHVEHIMPKTLSPSWDISKEEHDENLWKLGNLMLLSGLSNVKISNGSFETKKKRIVFQKLNQIKISVNILRGIKKVSHNANTS